MRKLCRTHLIVRLSRAKKRKLHKTGLSVKSQNGFKNGKKGRRGGIF